jgi:hypothetical protein
MPTMRAHAITTKAPVGGRGGRLMKKPFVLIAAIVAVVGLGAAVAVAKETIKVGTSVTLQFQVRQPEHPSQFVGRVKASRGCQKGRTVTVTTGHNHGRRKVRSDKSGNRGKYKIIWRAHHLEPGDGLVPGYRNYRAVVGERKITKNDGDKIVCKAAASKVISVS